MRESYLSETFGLEHEDGTYINALDPCCDSEKCDEAPENRTESIFDKEISQMILKLELTECKNFQCLPG